MSLPTVEGSGDEFKDSFYLLLHKVYGEFLEFPCTLSRTDSNPWKGVAFYGSLFISLGIGFLCLLALSMACYKIYVFANTSGLALTVQLACLYIEVFANTLRSIFIIIDPLFMRRIFPVTVYSFMYLGLVSLSLATTVLIAFYWNEVLYNTKILKNDDSTFSIQKFLIPSIIVITILVLLDMTNGILWSAGKSLTLIKVFNSILFIASFASGSYLVITGSLVLWKLDRVQGKSKTLKMIKMITVQIMLSSIFIFMVAITGIVSVFGVFPGPKGLATLFVIHWIPLMLISIIQISAIRRKPKQGNSTSSSDNISTSPKPSAMELGRIE